MASLTQMNRGLAALLALPLLLVELATLPIEAQIRKPRIAVIEFTDTLTQTYRWRGQATTGEAITDMMTSELTQLGRFSIIERERLTALLREQKLEITGILDAETAAEAGRILGIDALVIGSITQAAIRERKIGFGKASMRRLTAEVWLDVRLVSAKTAEVIIAVTKEGTEGATGARGRTSQGDAEYVDTNNQSLMSGAAREAVRKVARVFGERATEIEMVSPMVWEAKFVHRDGKVHVQDGQFVFIDAGFIKGVKNGERLEVQRVDRSLSLPIPEIVAVLEVISNVISDGQASKCRILSGKASSLHFEDAVRRVGRASNATGQP